MFERGRVAYSEEELSHHTNKEKRRALTPGEKRGAQPGGEGNLLRRKITTYQSDGGD